MNAKWIIPVILGTALSAGAQEPLMPDIDPGEYVARPYKGRYFTVTDEGDSVMMVVMNPVTVYPTLRFKTMMTSPLTVMPFRDTPSAVMTMLPSASSVISPASLT